MTRVKWDYPGIAMKRSGTHTGVLDGSPIEVTLYSNGNQGAATGSVTIRYRGTRYHRKNYGGGLRYATESAREILRGLRGVGPMPTGGTPA